VALELAILEERGQRGLGGQVALDVSNERCAATRASTAGGATR